MSREAEGEDANAFLCVTAELQRPFPQGDSLYLQYLSIFSRKEYSGIGYNDNFPV